MREELLGRLYELVRWRARIWKVLTPCSVRTDIEIKYRIATRYYMVSGSFRFLLYTR